MKTGEVMTLDSAYEKMSYNNVDRELKIDVDRCPIQLLSQIDLKGGTNIYSKKQSR